MLSLFIFSCEKEEGNFMVFTGQNTYNSDGGMNFQGRLQMDASVSIVDHGFIVSNYSGGVFSDTISLGNKTEDGNFHYLSYNGLIPGKDYYIVSYAKSKDKTLFGEKLIFSTLVTFSPKINEVLPNPAYLNDTITLKGEHFLPYTGSWDILIEYQKAEVFSLIDSTIYIVKTELLHSSDSIIIFVLPDILNYKKSAIFFSSDKALINSGAFVTIKDSEIDSLNSCCAYPGDIIKIYGKLLGNSNTTKVYCDNEECSVININEKTISFSLPLIHNKNSVDIILNILGFDIIAFENFELLRPYIQSITPEIPRFEDTIIVTGENFINDDTRELKIQLGPNQIIQPISVDSNEVRFSLAYPDQVKFDLQIDINGRLSNPFEITMAPPEIYGFTPDKIRYNEEFTIFGANFHQNFNYNKVSIDGVNLDIIGFYPDKIITRIPYQLNLTNVGSPIVVSTLSNYASSSENVVFDDFRVDEISPDTLSENSHAVITGENFSQNPKVYLNDVLVSNIESKNSNEFLFYPDFNIEEGWYSLKIVDNGHEKTFNNQFYFNKTFTRLNDFPGGPIGQFMAFSVKNKAYIGGGMSAVENEAYILDFWEYFPETDTWIQRADLPEYSDMRAYNFNTNNYCYFGSMEKLWRYNPSSDSWERMADYPLADVLNKMSFAIGNDGYVGGGYYRGSIYSFHKYSEVLNTWIAIRDTPVQMYYELFPNANHETYGLIVDEDLDDLRIYNSETDSWETRNFLNRVSTTTNISTSNIGDDFYISFSEISTSFSRTIFYKYNIMTEEIESLGTLPLEDRVRVGTFRIGDFIYFLGGFDLYTTNKTFPYLLKYDTTKD